MKKGELMSNFQPKQLLSAGRQAVAGASYDPKKLTLIHAGISAAAGFLVTLMSYLLSLGMDQVGGLSGMSHLAALETAQTILEVLLSILGPFWALGFIAAAIHWARGNDPTPHTLLTGLRRWGPVLRMMLLQGFLYVGVMMLCAQVGSFVYMLTPFATQLQAILLPLANTDVAQLESLEQLLLGLDYDALLHIALTMIPFLFLPGLILVVLLAYRMRLAPYILMDEPRCGAVFAVIMSFKLTRKHTLELFRLDLNFWWFYVLEAVIALLCYGELILPLLGLELGINPVLASFLFYALALVCQTGLYIWQKPRIFATYALFYDGLIPREAEEEI
jgi:hypothetical protein